MKRAALASSATGALALLAIGVSLGSDALVLARLSVLGAALGQLVRYDLREHRIPNRIVLPAAVICGVLSILDRVPAASFIFGALLVAVLLCVSLARPVWLGMGDVKLALLLLCALDSATPRALILTVELYAVIALLLIIRRGRAAFGVALPLAPFMAAGSLLALLT
jgi:leader peptidase (prepilin peptidase)/N-methyltransferase